MQIFILTTHLRCLPLFADPLKDMYIYSQSLFPLIEMNMILKNWSIIIKKCPDCNEMSWIFQVFAGLLTHWNIM